MFAVPQYDILIPPSFNDIWKYVCHLCLMCVSSTQHFAILVLDAYHLAQVVSTPFLA